MRATSSHRVLQIIDSAKMTDLVTFKSKINVYNCMLLVQQCYSPCLYSYPQSLQLYNSYRINRDHVVLKTVFGLELWFMGRSMRYY